MTTRTPEQALLRRAIRKTDRDSYAWELLPGEFAVLNYKFRKANGLSGIPIPGDELDDIRVVHALVLLGSSRWRAQKLANELHRQQPDSTWQIRVREAFNVFVERGGEGTGRGRAETQSADPLVIQCRPCSEASDE